MDKILLHIEKLLINNDFVVVPDLGGFVVQNQSTQIKNNFLTSPGVTLGFNPMIKQEDGLLALSLSRDLKISYRESATLIRKEIYNFKNQISEGSTSVFGNLGHFTLDDSGKIQFEPSEELFFLPGNLGACSLKLESKTLSEVGTVHFSNRFMKYAAILILVFGLFFTSSKISNGTYVNTANILSVNSILPQITEEATEIEDSVIEEKHFHIIVAAFHSEKVSSKFCNDLINSNFDNAIVIKGNKINKIAIDSFSSQEDAEFALKSLRSSNPEYKDAWILKN